MEIEEFAPLTFAAPPVQVPRRIDRLLPGSEDTAQTEAALRN
jgi:hypothetical protein